MKGWRKSGQVSLFVLLGILVLVLVGVAIYLKTEPQKEQLKREVTEVIPGEFVPVKQFVEQCVYELGKEALVKAGQHGGHVEPLGITVLPEFPTQSSGVELAPGSGIIIPYWFYLRSSDRCQENCVFDSLRPPLSRLEGGNSVEEQVDQYVEAHLPVCLNRFKAFKDQFTIKELAPVKVTTTIAQGVSFFVEYPLEVSRDQMRQRISQYEAKIPLNFKELYDVATVLLQLVEDPNIRFFERLSLSVVGAYGLGKDTVIPPMEGGTHFGLGAPKIWEKSKVKGEVQALLVDNVPVVDVLGTLNSQWVLKDDPHFNGIYSNYHITLDTTPPVDLSSKSIEFDYLDWWPMYFDMPQSKGELVMPDTVMSFFLVPIGIQNFDFTYDFSFPVGVRIRDVDSLSGEGFLFQYAFEVNVRNNRPLESLQGPTVKAGGSLFCDSDKRNSGLVTISTKSVEGAPLGEVTVGFSCAGETCFVGKTDETGKLVSQLPICMDGVLSPTKEDFYGAGVRLSTELNQGGSVALGMEKVKLFKASVVRLPLLKIPPVISSLTGARGYKEDKWNEGVEWQLTQNPMPLRSNEKVVVVLERVSQAGEEPFMQVLNVEGNQEGELKLTPGLYNYQAFLFAELNGSQAVRVPKRRLCYDTQPLVPFCCDECVDIDAMEFNESFMEGHVALDGSTSGSIQVSSGNMGASRVVFFVPGPDLKDIEYQEDLLVLDFIENLSISNRASFLPKFG